MSLESWVLCPLPFFFFLAFEGEREKKKKRRPAETLKTTAGRIRKIDAAVVQVSKPVGNSRH